MSQFPSAGRNAVVHHSTRDNIHIIYFTYTQPDDASEFDLAYTGNHHGVKPMNPLDPEKEKSIDNIEIDLKRGKNEVSLLLVNSIADIKNITIEFVDGKEAEVSLVKKSFNPVKDHKVTVRTNELYSVRTMFVAYRDTYTQLYITSPSDAVIRINC